MKAPVRDMTNSRHPAALAGRILLLAWLGAIAPATGYAQNPQEQPAAPAADPAKGKQNLCPAGWGKRPRRTGGPGAEVYVNAWKPCKTEPQPSVAEPVPMPLPLAAR